MEMDDKGLPLCSQSFFVSQRTGPNKLSLTMKNMDKSKDLSRSRCKKKSSRTRGSARGRPSSALTSRFGGKGLFHGTMDRYFGGSKDSYSSCIRVESEEDEPSTSGISDRQNCLIDTSSSVPFPPPEDCTSKFKENNPVRINVQDSLRSDEDGDSESTMEAQSTESAFLHDNESNDGVGTEHMTGEDKIDVLMCPICWKSFDSKDTQTAHMKLCAVKHKMSTKQLLDALELVQRQEAERKSLGLPLLANKILKKPKKEPSHSSVKTKTASDGYLQLGLALSASLIEAEREKERDHLLEAGLIEEANEKGLLPTQDISESIAAKTAPIFLNVGKKTGDEVKIIPKVRRKNAKYNFGGRVPAILKRTVEERERLITEKVAVILVGDDASVSGKTDSINGQRSTLPAWKIRSKEIKKFIDKENIWWTLAGTSPSSVSQRSYYVDSLNEFISPSKIVAGAKLKHLSQIPGRNNTPDKVSLVHASEKGSERCTSLATNIPELDQSNQRSSKKHSVKRNLFCESPKVYSSNSLSRDWNLLVGKKEMSDISIFTREDREVPAHKLVFYVRCPSVLKDVVEERRCNVSSYLLIWSEACYASVMAFLKFTYGGELEVSTLNENVIEDLRHLTVRYHLSELQSILDKAIISSRSPEVDRLSEVGSHVIEDLPNVQNEEFSLTEHQRYDLDCQIESPKMKDCEKTSLLNPDNEDVTNKPWLTVESPANRKDDGGVDIGEIIVRNSTSPSPSAPTLSSPDIFHGSTSNSLGSPKSVMVVDEVQTVNETLDESNLSQSSRSSIDYLVSLMEKESESSGLIVEEQDSQGARKVPDQFLENSSSVKTLNSLSESVAQENKNGCKTPITPTVLDKTGESIVYPTPAPREKVLSEGIKDSFSLKENSLKDSKRKLLISDVSDSSTPTLKKMCLLGDGEDYGAIKSMSADEQEVVDLTLSSPNQEDAAENSPFNTSTASTIPPPLAEDPSILEDEKANPNDSFQNTSYISNVWDGFDHISDMGYPLTGGPGFGLESDSVKSINMKDSGEVASSVSVISVKSQKEDSPEKYGDVVHKVSSLETLVNVDVSTSPKSDKEESSDSPCHEEVVVASNDVDGLDLTEKLLNVSLQRINESFFWRDEHEPVEGVGGNKGSPSTPRTPVEGKFSANSSNKVTPVNSSGSKYIRSANVTPLADFSTMKTPTLHKELDRYGIKHLKRNQAKKILRHIYNELHPIVSTSSECNGKSSNVNNKNEASGQSLMEKQSSHQPKKDKAPCKTFTLSSDEHSSSEEDGSDSSSDSVIFEESMYDPMESPVKEMTLSQKACTVDLPTGMKILIERNPEIHRKILLYEPLWLNDIKLALKEVGAKFNANQLMDYLDEKCITFRLAPGNRHRRKRAPKVKSMPLSQPCHSRSKGCSAISSSQPC